MCNNIQQSLISFLSNLCIKKKQQQKTTAANNSNSSGGGGIAEATVSPLRIVNNAIEPNLQNVSPNLPLHGGSAATASSHKQQQQVIQTPASTAAAAATASSHHNHHTNHHPSASTALSATHGTFNTCKGRGSDVIVFLAIPFLPP